MTVNREALKALVWKKMPADLKVTASGLDLITVGGKLVPVGALTNDELFATLRKVNVVKTILKALEVS